MTPRTRLQRLIAAVAATNLTLFALASLLTRWPPATEAMQRLLSLCRVG